jgi:hypothetical protein
MAARIKADLQVVHITSGDAMQRARDDDLVW